MTFGGRLLNYLLSFVDFMWSRAFLIDKVDQVIQDKIPGFDLQVCQLPFFWREKFMFF